MTTIACDGTSIAADGRMCDGSDMIVCEDAVKVERLADGSIMGFSGPANGQSVFKDWIEANGQRELKLTDFSALVLRPDGQIRFYDSAANWIPCSAPQALGTGKKLAIGAMAAGKSPEDAVMLATRFDPFTGGTITVFHVEPAP